MSKQLIISTLFLALPGMLRAEHIVIASKIFPENKLVAEMATQLIEHETDYRVTRRYGLGGTQICFKALAEDKVDLYPEYTGTGFLILGEQRRIRQPDSIWAFLQKTFQKRYNIEWVAPLGFYNNYALAAQERLPFRKISDLKGYNQPLKVGFSHEFAERQDGWLGLREHYDLSFPNIKKLEHGLIYKAVANDRVELTEVYTTDGRLEKYDLRLLKDDQNFFRQYDAAYLVRQQSLEKFPGLEEVLLKLKNTSSNKKMRHLNHLVEVEGQPMRRVAQNFLLEAGLLNPEEVQDQAIDWRYIGRKAGEHLFLTLLSTLVAVLVGVPLGLLFLQMDRLGPLMITLTGVIQTIPSLALLGFMIPLFGIGKLPALVALFLYGLLPIVSNTFTGIYYLDPALKEAATSLGMSSRQKLFQLEIPLALPMIITGIRTAAVINMGTATLAAFIGAGGLGEPIISGISLNDNLMIFSGAVPAAVLAFLLDQALGFWKKQVVREHAS